MDFCSKKTYICESISSLVTKIKNWYERILAAKTLRSAYRKFKMNGVKTDLFWDDKETHFIMVVRTDEIIDFLNENLQ